MRYLETLIICGVLLLGLTTSLLEPLRRPPSGLGHPRSGERVGGGVGPASDAPDVKFVQSSDKVEVYDFVEVAVTVRKPTAKNPFTDVALTAEFRHGDADPMA